MIHMKKDGEWLVGHLVEDAASVGALLREQWRLPRKQVHLLFQHKEVLLDGTPAAQLAEAKAGQEIRLRLCRPEPLGLAPLNEPADILYEDDHLLVANKPPGLLLHPTEPRHTRTLDHLIAGHFARTGVAAKVRHVHRLDQDTSGVVLYAKHALASALLDERLRERNISRTYIAFVHGMVKQDSGTISQPIGKDRHHPNRRRVSSNGDPAVTHYRVVERYAQASKLECRLETGRTHQIRVHLSHLGHPLLGDTLYGGKGGMISRQALHAAVLRFSHPFGERPMEVRSPLPDDLLRLEQTLRQAPMRR
ncbi:RluA family pseudouridine synthase [Brevibacillus sp. MCWH]|uniref:RluA family pseudouridine synthase n=1 Tax=Brevibacillus sp. MCWH TaxID=2508871 RepID=UPI0014924CF8|nr:RluA family pseudouridine synthase [Brevibacillus sp. MCWH]NNV02079.1 RluA family pseudouridine synthase [Brevibacillus sp. MCWH]